MDISLITIKCVRQKDKKRLRSTAQSVTPTAQGNRRKRKERRFTNIRQWRNREIPRYSDGIAV